MIRYTSLNIGSIIKDPVNIGKSKNISRHLLYVGTRGGHCHSISTLAKSQKLFRINDIKHSQYYRCTKLKSRVEIPKLL